jgi:hypothetical protein
MAPWHEKEGSLAISAAVEQKRSANILNEVASEARNDSLRSRLSEECTEELLVQVLGRRVHQLRLFPEHKGEIVETR